MRTWLLASTAVMAAIGLSPGAQADVVTLGFSGAGVHARLQLTIVPSSPTGPLVNQPNTVDPVGSFTVTDITGRYSNASLPTPIIGAEVTGIVPRTFDPPRDPFPTNTMAPRSLSFLPSGNSYDNLYYPNGSPQTANNWPFSGGVLDIYGLAFTIDGGYTVNLWSNGVDTPAGPGLTYGVALIQGADVLDYKFGELAAVPEPATFLLFGAGLLGLAGVRSRQRH
ncbi:hypothetical protein DFH01_27570 [Falsiroseomonas bella]|uniref:Ice-binding protein C-terminal domain-containing protein n=1 Tax=Falsiroseomonas bella TaxID=2184016 RepID=A0A317F452_9PROT|nr:PEP-CTERM sorting domain-containing protein [Falsiroseomonas bella]PWS33951.1 hypothetical protein DFH01_27570 [Falsiroseomonas bella]